MKKVVELNDFMKHLKDNDLLIVRKDDYFKKKEIEIGQLQRALLKKKNASPKEIIDAKVLRITTKHGLIQWVKKGEIREYEHFKNSKGEHMIRVEAIKRILENPKKQSVYYQSRT